MPTTNKLMTLKLKRRILNNSRLTNGFFVRDSCMRKPAKLPSSTITKTVCTESPMTWWVRRSNRNTSVVVIAKSNAAPR